MGSSAETAQHLLGTLSLLCVLLGHATNWHICPPTETTGRGQIFIMATWGPAAHQGAHTHVDTALASSGSGVSTG